MSTSEKESQKRLVIDRELQEFQIDRQAQGFTPKTLSWYEQSLGIFRAFIVGQGIEETEGITPTALRMFLVHLAERGHSEGGVVNIYGAVKAYLNWFAAEYDPTGWDNPLRKVKSPKRTKEIEPPLSVEHFRALARACDHGTFAGARDRAVILVLFDSGVRKQELCDLRVGDINMKTGDVTVRSGKGRKTRVTMVSAKTRRALAKYLRYRPEAEDKDPLWTTLYGRPLTPSGMRQVIRRAAERAQIPEPGFHAFRRAFAINCLRSGMDIERLRRMLGHEDLTVISRYLDIADGDLREAHSHHSPVENLL